MECQRYNKQSVESPGEEVTDFNVCLLPIQQDKQNFLKKNIVYPLLWTSVHAHYEE